MNYILTDEQLLDFCISVNQYYDSYHNILWITIIILVSMAIFIAIDVVKQMYRVPQQIGYHQFIDINVNKNICREILCKLLR